MTNNHVLETPAQAAASAAEFGYEQDLTGRVQVGTSTGFDPDTLFLTDPALDYTLVAVQPTGSAAGPRLTGGMGAGSSVKQCDHQGRVREHHQHPGGQPRPSP